MAQLMTSLEEIKRFGPCPEGWRNILNAHKEKPHTEKFPLTQCLESNSAEDVLWLIGNRNKSEELSIPMDVAKAILRLADELGNDPEVKASWLAINEIERSQDYVREAQKPLSCSYAADYVSSAVAKLSYGAYHGIGPERKSLVLSQISEAPRQAILDCESLIP